MANEDLKTSHSPTVSLHDPVDPRQVPSLQHQWVNMKWNGQDGAPNCDSGVAKGAVIRREAQCSKASKEVGRLGILNLAGDAIESRSVITELDVRV